jgi:hypothetical protein
LQREQDVVYEAIANSMHRPEATSMNMRWWQWHL